MQIQIKDIKCGDVFYAVKIDGEFPLFNKFIALSHPTAKQVKVKKYKNGYSALLLKQNLNFINTWRVLNATIDFTNRQRN